MKQYKFSVIILVLTLCIIAIALGYAGSKNIPAESATTVNIKISSAGMVIPQYMITSEVENILLEIDQEYPGSVIYSDYEVTLVDYDAINKFKQSIDENEVDFDLDSVYSFYNLDSGAVISNIEFSPVYNSITISYDELDKLLNGDNDTVSYYRDLLNNSQSDILNPDENVTTIIVCDAYNASNGKNSVAFVTINSSGE
ncbi:hypothetical protein V7O61_06175 [Methanolobus sp. WCC1]|uniref:hypothetical protein n=1 Tax=unclassified Methanolobus TaxID=2629569 RepID=UPI00324EA22F